MKKENGITLMSLIIYVAIMIVILGVMGIVITNFYNNTNSLQGNVAQILEFNKFNNYFLKEVKTTNNKVDNITENYILFTSGNSFSISESSIYYNNIKICDGVQEIKFTLVKDEEDAENEYSIINASLTFENFNKSINYKLENIY